MLKYKRQLGIGADIVDVVPGSQRPLPGHTIAPHRFAPVRQR